MVDYEKLEYLRRNTLLGINDLIKIARMKHEADKERFIINKAERCNIGVDYSKADQYEFEKRFNDWMEKTMPLWQKHADGLDLYEFATMALEDSIRIEKEEYYERIYKPRVK